MRFTLQNLGRLREATIDLSKDLILLTGPNNTSKTYVAHTIYGFCKSLQIALMELLKPLIIVEGSPSGHIDVDMGSLVRDHWRPIAHQLGEQYRARLADVLAADEPFTEKARVTIDQSEFKEAIDLSIQEFSATVEVHESIGVATDRSISINKAQHSSVVTFSLTSPHSSQEMSDSFLLVVTAYISYRFAELLFDSTINPFILTAERSAIQLFSRELSLKRSELVDNLLTRTKTAMAGDPFSLLNQRARRYPLPIRDSLRIADDLALLKKNSSPYAPLADRLERDILQGSLWIGDDGEMTFQPEQADAGIGMHLASSSVKALSGLSFYLRHLARKEQFLIIDEPELNLHPDNQRRVARLLARLARAGIKVMMSTHSDYVIREINNLIMLSADREGELRRRLGYDEEETLTPTQVGAYLFDATMARPIDVKATGIEVKTIDDEINRLNSAAQDIYFSLFEKSSA